MPVSTFSDKVDFGARVSREDYEEFRRYFPAYGATTWFITNALNEFLLSVRNDPDARERVKKLIERMVQENRETI